MGNYVANLANIYYWTPYNGEHVYYYSRKSNIFYEGQWENYKRHGFGTMHYADGSYFHGLWEYDQPIKGTYENDEFTYEGEVARIYDNVILSKKTTTNHISTAPRNSTEPPILNGEGVMLFKNNPLYKWIKGEWFYGKKDGRFKVCYKNEKECMETWRADKLNAKIYDLNGIFSQNTFEQTDYF